MSEPRLCPVCGAVQQQIGTLTMYGEPMVFPPAIWATSGTKRVKYVQERTCELTFKRGAIYDVAHYSCCGYEFPEPISEVAPSENYCPNCGARVEVEK